jgi:hypothetical protein
MLASGSFSRRARVARDVASRGYCAAKKHLLVHCFEKLSFAFVSSLTVDSHKL